MVSKDLIERVKGHKLLNCVNPVLSCKGLFFNTGVLIERIHSIQYHWKPIGFTRETLST